MTTPELSDSKFVLFFLAHVEQKLAHEGFMMKPDESWGPGLVNRSFERTQHPWKMDKIDIVYPTSTKDQLEGIEVVFRVLVGDRAGNWMKLDGIGLSSLVGRETNRYLIPRFAIFGNFRKRRFANSIVEDIASGLAWFREFDSVPKCLSRLRAGQTNLGAIKDRGAARSASDLLEKMSEI